MLERGDMATLHEPFLYLYYVHDGKKRLPHLEVDPRRPTSYEDVRSMILETARNRPVFVKDMCYYVSDHLHDDVDFIRRMASTFLIRDPARSIPSYFRLDPGATLEEIGCEAQYRCFERIGEVTGQTPVVIDAADLAEDPASTLRAYCRALGLPFIPEALEMEPGAAGCVARRRRLARRPRRLHGHRQAAVVRRSRTGCRAPPPRLLRASPALLPEDAGTSTRTGIAYLIHPTRSSRRSHAPCASMISSRTGSGSPACKQATG